MNDATTGRALRTCLVLLGVLIAVVAVPAPALGAGDGQAKNVILLIGDGMGPVQVEAARWEKAGHDPAAYASTTLAMDGLPYTGTVGTASANNAVTDSAAAATALMTGTRTNNGMIGAAPDGSALATIAELAKADGKATGAITTTRITHATPAGVYAHVGARGDELVIARQFIDSDLDVALGGGYPYFIPQAARDPWGQAGLRTDYRDLVAEARAQGYTVATTASELGAVPATPGAKALGLFASGYMSYEGARAGTTQPSVAAMTGTALSVLSTDPDGFFLMVEGGQIDTAAHAGQYALMTGETLAFDDAVATALAWAAGRTDTLVIVTADHETGGLTRTTNPDGSLSFSFTSTGHTATDVPLKASGPGAESLGGGRILNTQVFDAMYGAMGLGVEVPVASFTAAPASGTAPLAVWFTDASTGSPTSWSWTFGDGASSSAQSPTHTYTAPGTYTVGLTASNSAGSGTTTRTVTVLPAEPPLVASFTADRSSGAPPLAVRFTDTTTGSPVAWRWEFGDRMFSAEQSPLHTYAKAGTYTVRLTVTDGLGRTATATQAKYITVAKPPRR